MPCPRRKRRHLDHGALGVVEAIWARPPPEAALVAGITVGKEHAVGDLVDDAREALVRRLAADVEPFADLLPGRRRRALGRDGQAQDLVGLADEAERVLDELAGTAIPVTVVQQISTGVPDARRAGVSDSDRPRSLRTEAVAQTVGAPGLAGASGGRLR